MKILEKPVEQLVECGKLLVLKLLERVREMAKFAIDMKVDLEMICERYGLEEDEAVEMLEAFVEELEGRSMSGMSGVVNILEMANVFDN